MRATVRAVLQDREAEGRYWRAFGAWVKEQRNSQLPERWTQDRLADELRRRGARASRNWIVQIEKGDRPSVELRREIEKIFGPFPEPIDGGAPTEEGTAAAIDRQTAVLRLLVDETRKAREAQEITAQAVGEMVGRLDQFLGLVGRPSEPELANGGGNR